MTNGICPNCSAAQIYRFEAMAEQGGIWIGIFTRLPLHYFLCTQCGYLEQYVLDAGSLQAVREKAEYVAPLQS